MRLRQEALYLRAVTMTDVLDAGIHLRLVSSLEALTGTTWTAFQDLARPRMPVQSLEGARSTLLDAHVGAGFHQSARWVLSADPESPLRSFELHAGLHPYSGVYVTQLDARLDAGWADANADAVTSMARDWVTWLEPLSLHAHDVDDHAIQNCASAAMLKLGYGIEVDEVDLAANPGRERHRGQYRFCTDWLTYYGAETVALIERECERTAWTEPPEPLANGWWFRLYERPSQATTAEGRAIQQRVRDEIGYDALVQKDRRIWGYWQRKG